MFRRDQKPNRDPEPVDKIHQTKQVRDDQVEPQNRI